MNILGLSDYPGSHDMSAALVVDGRLVAAAEEERFTRRKHQGGIALNAVEYCLLSAGLSMGDIDCIAFTEPPYRTGPHSQHADTDIQTLRRLHEGGEVRYRSLLHKQVLDVLLALKLPLGFSGGMSATAARALSKLRGAHGKLPPLRFYDHHRCHAAAAFFTSPFEESAVVTVDGRGGNHATVTWQGHGTTLRRLTSEPYNNSLGHFYRDCTAYVGLGEFGQGKMMGLAAYGNAARFRDVAARLLDTLDARPYKYVRAPSEEVVGFAPVGSAQPVTDAPIPDFAASVQHALQDALGAVARSALDASGSRHLCLGGGVALNCSANGALLDEGVADDYWLFPACGDAGLSIGGALLCAVDAGELKREVVSTAYWGPEYARDGCEQALRSAQGVVFQELADVAGETSRLLADSQVVGWFQGRMEIGPRALGHRSILADPRTAAMRDRVNRIKHREAWRPLAPMVLEERAAEYFTPVPPVPFMLFAVGVRPEKRSEVAAIVHVDGSARPQLVARADDEKLHDLLSAFAKRTGVPMLLNTSFNLAGEPMVCTPSDAIRTFLASELDALILGDFLVQREAR